MVSTSRDLRAASAGVADAVAAALLAINRARARAHAHRLINACASRERHCVPREATKQLFARARLHVEGTQRHRERCRVRYRSRGWISERKIPRAEQRLRFDRPSSLAEVASDEEGGEGGGIRSILVLGTVERRVWNFSRASRKLASARFTCSPHRAGSNSACWRRGDASLSPRTSSSTSSGPGALVTANEIAHVHTRAHRCGRILVCSRRGAACASCDALLRYCIMH